MIKVNLSNANINLNKLSGDYQPYINRLDETLKNKTGLGSNFLGWMTYPNDISKSEIDHIHNTVQELYTKGIRTLIVIGIGGSYAGSKAAIEMINGLHPINKPEVLFVGQNMSSLYIEQIIKKIENTPFAINVISKSGTTLEPALAFRVFRTLLETKVGLEEAKNRIIVTTDKEKGLLKKIANKNGYKTFVIPDDVGGRFSVLTPVGLFPIAFAGINILKIIEGAREAILDTENVDILKNEAYKYAAARHHLYLKEKMKVELMVFYDPQTLFIGEWWKQLFAESEGKEGKGLFPASGIFSTDLHSFGQFIQDGTKLLFETVLKVKNLNSDLHLPQSNHKDDDELDYLLKKSFNEINQTTLIATVQAHSIDGSVPNIIMEIDNLSEKAFGYFVQFMFKACAISAYLLNINPFNQPGVEVYKTNLHKQLKKKV